MTNEVIPPAQAAMSHLLTPEGLANLKGKLGPVQLVQGSLLFKDNQRKTDKVEQRPVADRSVTEVSTVGAKDYALFTLGVVYWSLRIPFDLVDQFLHSEYGEGAVVQRLGVPVTVLPDVPGWETVIEAINKEGWDNLVLFLSECIFSRGPNYWTICGDFCPSKITESPKRLPLAVFTPRSLATRLRPWVDGQGCVRLSEERVQDAVVQNNYTRKLTLAIEGGVQ